MERIKKIKRPFRFAAGKVVIGFLLASLAGGLLALPAMGQDFRRPHPRDRDRFYEQRRPYPDRYYHRRVYRPYVPPRPIYVPPPVIYDPPPPPPGIQIFFPPIIIR